MLVWGRQQKPLINWPLFFFSCTQQNNPQIKRTIIYSTNISMKNGEKTIILNKNYWKKNTRTDLHVLTAQHREENKSSIPREKILVSHKIKHKMKCSQIIGNLKWRGLPISWTDAGGWAVEGTCVNLHCHCPSRYSSAQRAWHWLSTDIRYGWQALPWWEPASLDENSIHYSGNSALCLRHQMGL